MPRRKSNSDKRLPAHPPATSPNSLNAVRNLLIGASLDLDGTNPVELYRTLITSFFESLFLTLADQRGMGWQRTTQDLPTISDVDVVCNRLADEWRRNDIAPALGFGSVYQHLLSYEPSFDGERRSLALTPVKRSARKSSGSYYTPDALIQQLLDDALDPVLDEAARADNPIFALRKVKVCDPACGSGLFLIAAGRRIADRLKAAGYDGNAMREVVLWCTHGVDIDPIAVELCRFSLWLEAGDEALTRERLAKQVACLNSLTAPLIVCDEQGSSQLDVMIGNPPWLSLSGRQRVAVSPELLRHLERRYPEIAAWPALHSAFVIMAAGWVRNGGRVGMVLPLPMAYLDGYRGVRAAIARDCDHICVRDAGEEAFARVTQATGLFSFRRNYTGRRTRGPLAPWPITPAVGAASVVFEPDPAVRQLRKLPAIPARTFRDSGIHTGNMSAILVRERLDVDHDRFHPVREGRDIAPFSCAAPRLMIDTDPDRVEGQYCRIGSLDRYVSIPILLRQTSDRPIAARHVEPAYFRNSVLACEGLPGIPHEVTIAVLNSDLITRWYRSQFCDVTQRSFPQIKVRNLQQMPMFDRARLADIVDPFVDCVRRIEEAVRVSGAAAAVEHRAEIETLVCRLYGIDSGLTP
jgi:hypothetical protein